MKTLLCILTAIGLLTVASTEASAQARHERVKVTPIKAKGKVVGARIKGQLRPAGSYNKVQLVIGKAEKGKYGPSTYRDAAAGKTKGYVLQKGPAVKDVKEGAPFEIKISYGKGFKGGETVDVTSVWSRDGGSSALHVWGMTRSGIPPATVTLPTAD